MKRERTTPHSGLTSAVLLVAVLLVPTGCASRSSERALAPADSVATGVVGALPDSSSTGAATDVILRYYAAITAHAFGHAYAQWEGNGAASGRTFEAFRAGFANTARVAVETGAPGAIEGAAGSRYVEIPVVIRATTLDGREQRFAGSYVLRRSDVDGASAEQRHWHIYSAKIREQPAKRP